MSERRPYDGYEPNEPATGTGGFAKKPLSPAKPMTRASAPDNNASKWSADAWESPVKPERAYAQRTWDEEDYANQQTPAAPSAPIEYPPQEAAAPRRAAHSENPYTRATWDETEYEPDPAYRANAYDAADQTGTDPYGETPSAQERQRPAFDPGTVNRYVRPAADAADGVSDLSARFAPPLKFEMPGPTYAEAHDPAYAPEQGEPNVYQTRRPAMRQDAMAYDPAARGAYRVEAEDGRRGRRAGKMLKRMLIAIVIIAALGAAAYLNRGWILEQLKPLLGEKTVESVNQAVNQAVGAQQAATVGYDAAPALTVGDQTQKGMDAVAGGIGLETYAVTNNNVISRLKTGEGKYDYYLFAAKNGQLLGYYEGLGENGMLVCANDVYYVTESPYLIDSQGLPLINASRYQQAAGADAVLGPMINGWAIIQNAKGGTFNYINAEGNFLSTLWFAKAYPFTGSATLAYVDTGNVTDPNERYTLYELDRNGGMTMWRHAANMDDVLGCATGVACMSNGQLILLNGKQTLLCTSDDVAAYVDCGAVVARDTSTGKYALYVNGEKHYDFAYDSIAPVPSDIQWAQSVNGLYKQYTVTGVAYPLPLSHYFALKKGDSQEMVALSTASVYPLALDAPNAP